jgi:hypothetical protein
VEILTILIAGGAIVGVTVYFARKQLAEWRTGCARFDDVEDTSALMVLSLRTRAPVRAAEVQAAGGGKNNPQVWSVRSTSRIGARTTLDLSREGSLGALRERVGWQDVHIGDAGFDAAYTVRGSEPDVVRGIFAAAATRDAVRALFEGGTLHMCRIESGGGATAVFQRSGHDVDTARGRVLAFVRFLDALDERSDAPPRALQDAGGSVGGGSGAPVGVPLRTSSS